MKQMRIIAAPDSFKGSLGADEVCGIIAEAARRVFPEAETVSIPVGDGGEGTAECLISAGAKKIEKRVCGPYGEPVDAFYIMLPDKKTAYVEMAAAAGLTLSDIKRPEIATTYGVGELIADAVTKGAEKILLGLGGSATNDGGLGMASALGFEFADSEGIPFIPVGRSLKYLAAFTAPDIIPDITGICDVENPLYGPDGAAYCYAPQKGADPVCVKMLDEGLRRMAEVIDPDTAFLPGAGAAGGMGYAVSALFGGKNERGIEFILDAVGFDGAINGADIVITGEGSVDYQSPKGKVISGVAKRAHKKGIPVIVLCGIQKDDVPELYKIGVSAVIPCTRYPLSSVPSHDEAAKALLMTAENIFRVLKINNFK